MRGYLYSHCRILGCNGVDADCGGCAYWQERAILELAERKIAHARSNSVASPVVGRDHGFPAKTNPLHLRVLHSPAGSPACLRENGCGHSDHDQQRREALPRSNLHD